MLCAFLCRPENIVFRILKREWWKHPAGLQKSLP